MCHLPVRELGKKFLHGKLSLRNLLKGMRSRLKGLPPQLVTVQRTYRGRITLHQLIAHSHELVRIGIVGLPFRERLEASVLKHSLFQQRRRKPFRQLLSNTVLVQGICKRQPPNVPHGCPHIKSILSLFQQICGLLYLSQIIVGSHVLHGKFKGKRLRLARFKSSCLFKGCQLSCRLSQNPARCLKVNLNHLSARHMSGIGHTDRHSDHAVPLSGLSGLHLKGRIGKPVAKGIVYLPGGTGYGLKITVAHINVFRVAHVILGFVEIVRGRIVLQTLCKGIAELSGRISVPHKELGCRKAALHTSLPCHQYGPDPFIRRKPGGIHHSAYIHDYNDFGKALLNRLHHRRLFHGKAEISVPEDFCGELRHLALALGQLFVSGTHHTLPVPALTGKPAYGDDRRIRIGLCLREELLWHSGLYGHPGCAVFLILPLHVLPVIIAQGLKNTDMSALHFQTLIQTADISHRNVSASAPALHIVKRRLPEKSHPGPFLQGKQSSFILEQNHSLLCGIF